MSDWRHFVCKEAQSNKFWKFRYVDGSLVEKKWGRIGGNISSQTKIFGTSYAAQSYADGEVRKKLRKGYVEESAETLAEATEVAQTIGTRWKIDRIEFLAQAWDKHESLRTMSLQLGDTYLPMCGVYVELLESWKKERVFLIINKDNAMAFRSGNVHAGVVDLADQTYPVSNFVNGVRKQIQNAYKAVEEVLVKFGAVGVRILSLDDIETTLDPEARTAFQAVATKTGMSNAVISKFAAVGKRVLEI